MSTTLSKKEQLKQIIDEENLDSPVNSVEFLQYVQKHQKKVEVQKKRLSTISRALMILGIGALSVMAYRFFMSTRVSEPKHNFSGKHHRLGASNDTAEAEVYSQTFSALSMAIWGLVIAKAKAGQEAASSKDSASVGSIVKKVGTICALIATASMFQLMSSLNTTNPVEAVTKATQSSHKLQASNTRHPASYYDKSSSHYMGGVHNRLIQAAKSGELNQQVRDTKKSQPTEVYGHNLLIEFAQDSMNGKAQAPKNLRSSKQQQPTEVYGHNLLIDFAETRMSGKSSVVMPTQAAMGGAHNVAMQVLAQKSNEFKNARSAKNTSSNSFFQPRKQSHAQYQKNLQGTLSFLGFIATLAVCMYYYVVSKTYHAHLEKLDQLNALLNNPNARVASGKKGKEIMKKLQSKQKEIKAKATPEKAQSASTIDDLISAAKEKKTAEEACEKLLSAYQAPVVQSAPVETPIVIQQPQVNYTLIEPVAPQPVKTTTVTSNNFAN